jgi:SAM-dependent methyltransferase
MTEELQSVVARGYDLAAEAYSARFSRSSVRDYWLAGLIALAPAGARALDLGCGDGLPAARELTAHGFEVIGVDGSARQIERAIGNVPAAKFMIADMRSVEFPPESFDVISAFYSITHVPRDEHAALLGRIAGWLRPGGLFVASLGADNLEDWRGEWLGVEMFFSHYDAETNKRLVRDAGLVLEQAEVVVQDNEDARFLWVIARQPGP